MEKHESAIQKITTYIGNLERPNLKMKAEEFEEASYSIWAAEEILDRVINNCDLVPPHISGKLPLKPIQIIAFFADEMDFFVCDGGGKMFKIAKNVAEDIGRLFV